MGLPPKQVQEPLVSKNSGQTRRIGKSAGFTLHPILFGLFPLLSLYAANVGLVPWTDTVRPILLDFFCVLIVWGLLAVIVRAPGKAAAITSAFSLFFFSYGHLYNLSGIKDWAADNILIYTGLDTGAISPHLYLLPIWCIFALAVTAAILRSRRNFAPLTAILNVVGAALVAGPLVTIATSRSRYPGLAPVFKRHTEASAAEVSTKTEAPEKELEVYPLARAVAPDIYYIILDAYGRQDVLQKFYGYDNRPFLKQLESRGFFVADHARANYAQTICSLDASLNMDYLSVLTAGVAPDSTDITPISRGIDHNAVAAYLRRRRYRIVSISTGFGPTATANADICLGNTGTDHPPTYLNPYEGLILDITPLMLLPRSRDTLYDQHRRAILAGFSHLADVPRIQGRKFVFTHILAPHPPFVFDAYGAPIVPAGSRPFSIADGSDWFKRGKIDEYRRLYIDQLQFVNRKTIESIDAIRAQSKVPPIIIVQGDHGPRMFLSWKSAGRSDVRESFANLNAFYLPDGTAAKVFPPYISPVNSFRLLFNHLFNARFPRLPDRSFYTNPDQQYNFIDVTDRTNVEKPER